MGVGDIHELPHAEREARRAINSARWQERSVLSGLRANPIPRQRHDYGTIRGWRVVRRRPWAPYVIARAGRGKPRYAHLAARVYVATRGKARFVVAVAECGSTLVLHSLGRTIPENRELCWRCHCTVEHRP